MKLPVVPVILYVLIGFVLCGIVLQTKRNTRKEYTFGVSTVSEKEHQHSLDASSRRRQGLQCSSFVDDLMPLLKDSDQVFLVAPAKAGGTSLKHFVIECMADNDPNHGKDHHMDNFLNFEPGRLQMFYRTIEVPRLVASHIQNNYEQDAWRKLINTSSRRTLIITSFREETERIKSALHYIVPNKLCETMEPTFHDLKRHVDIKLTKDVCSVDEEGFIEAIVRNRYQEIGGGIYDQFNCEIWDEIDETGPRIMVVHHSQLQLLQTQISEHFCPRVKPKELNVRAKDTEAKKEYIIRSQTAGRNVTLDEWVSAKLPSMEWVFGLSGGTCKHRTNQMSDTLVACPDQFLRIYPRGSL